MKEELMKKATTEHMTPEQRAEAGVLAALPEDQINSRDLPEQKDWSGAQRGALFHAALKLDAHRRRRFRTEALSNAQAERIASSRMDPRHGRLNDLLDDVDVRSEH